MSFGVIRVINATIASGATTSEAAVLGGKACARVAVLIPSMATAAEFTVQTRLEAGSWYNVFHQTINSATVGTPLVKIASGVGANGGVAFLPNAGLQQLRFIASDTVANGLAIKVICSD